MYLYFMKSDLILTNFLRVDVKQTKYTTTENHNIRINLNLFQICNRNQDKLLNFLVYTNIKVHIYATKKQEKKV